MTPMFPKNTPSSTQRSFLLWGDCHPIIDADSWKHWVCCRRPPFGKRTWQFKSPWSMQNSFRDVIGCFFVFLLPFLITKKIPTSKLTLYLLAKPKLLLEPLLTDCHVMTNSQLLCLKHVTSPFVSLKPPRFLWSNPSALLGPGPVPGPAVAPGSIFTLFLAFSWSSRTS